MVPLPEPLHVHARSQFGLVTRAQALETLSRDAIRRRLKSGLLIPVARGVYRLPGANPSWRQRALTPCLALGGDVAVSHLAAAYLWRAESVAVPQVQLTVTRGRRPQVIRPTPRRSLLPAEDVTVRWGIPTTTPARTIIDLSTLVAQPLVERIFDDLCRDGHPRVEDLDRRLARGQVELGSPLPRHRAKTLDEILAARRRRGPGPGGSPREDWVVDTLLEGGLPAAVRNLIVEVGGVLRELDCAYLDHRVGIEYDGWRVHGDATHFHDDREKAAVLQLEGWIMLQVTSAWTDDLLVERVRTALARREAPVRSF